MSRGGEHVATMGCISAVVVVVGVLEAGVGIVAADVRPLDVLVLVAPVLVLEVKLAGETKGSDVDECVHE